LQHIATSQSQDATSQSQDSWQSKLEPFLDKDYRDSYIEGYVKGGIAYQIRALREKSGLSQKDFGDKIDKPQSVVSRLEDTEYGSVSVETLLDVAKALAVALQVKFFNYVDMLNADVSASAFKVDNIHESYRKNIPVTPLLLDNPMVTVVINANTSGGGTPWQKLPNLMRFPNSQGGGTPNIAKYIPT
jgi:transcriptional regulator with XRE-family HTH domain